MDVESPGGLTAKHGFESPLGPDSKLRRNSTGCYEVGTIFRETDGFYRVVECRPATSLMGPRWDIYLRRASPEDQLAAEIMLT